MVVMAGIYVNKHVLCSLCRWLLFTYFIEESIYSCPWVLHICSLMMLWTVWPGSVL